MSHIRTMRWPLQSCTPHQEHVMGVAEPSAWITTGTCNNCHLSQNGEVGLMRGQRKHDEVSIQAIQAVLGVWVPARPVPLLPDIAHHLVLPLPGSVGIRQDYLHSDRCSCKGTLPTALSRKLYQLPKHCKDQSS